MWASTESLRFFCVYQISGSDSQCSMSIMNCNILLGPWWCFVFRFTWSLKMPSQDLDFWRQLLVSKSQNVLKVVDFKKDIAIICIYHVNCLYDHKKIIYSFNSVWPHLFLSSTLWTVKTLKPCETQEHWKTVKTLKWFNYFRCLNPTSWEINHGRSFDIWPPVIHHSLTRASSSNWLRRK